MRNFIRNCTIAMLGTLFLMSSTCDPGYEFLNVQHVVVNNQTDEELMILSVLGNYPDITDENLKSIYLNFDSSKMLSSNSATVLDTYFIFEENGVSLRNMLLVLIIRRSTLDRYPFGYLLENNIFDDMFLLSYDELKSMKFEIVYKD